MAVDPQPHAAPPESPVAASTGAAVRAGEQRTGHTLALAAVALFSTSPVLVRWAGGVSAVEITFWRLLLAAATVVALGWLLRRPVRWRTLPQRRFAVYGVVIALHFFLYIAALFFTSVAHALALVYTAPLFIAVLSHVALGERLAPRRWLGVALGVAGVAVLTGFEPDARPGVFLGDVLAVGSAVAFAAYSVVGRAQRGAFPLFDYAAGVYGWGALWLLPLAAWNVRTSHYDLTAALSVVALGVGPLGLGHTLYNAALRRASATHVNLIATLEVVGGVALSAVLLGEVPSATSSIGAAIVLAGILVVVR
jgi:drug/metabolite transporter (DMT)-like permease